MRKRTPLRLFLILLFFAVDLPAAVPAATVDDAKKHASETIDRNADQIALVGDTLYYFAEPGMQEFESTKFLQGVLQKAGFAVELGGGGMPTALWARWGPTSSRTKGRSGGSCGTPPAPRPRTRSTSW